MEILCATSSDEEGGKVLFTFNSTYALKNEITVRIKWKVAVAFYIDISNF